MAAAPKLAIEPSDRDRLIGDLRIARPGEAPPRKKRGLSLWIVGAGALAGAIALFALRFEMAQPAPAPTAPAPDVRAATTPRAVLEATGHITARRQATVSAQITGMLSAVLIEEGERVEKNQVLARLEDSSLRAVLRSTEAQLESAIAQSGQYAIQYRQALRDKERAAQLFSQGMVTRQAAEQAAERSDAAEAQSLAQQHTVEAYRAQVAEAGVNLDHAIIRAPFGGVVTTKDAQVGEIVSPLSAGGGFTRTGVCTIVDMDSLEISVDVNESYIGRVRRDMHATAVLDAYPAQQFRAHVVAIIPTANRGKGTVRVRVALDESDPRIVPDMGVKVAFMGEDDRRQRDARSTVPDQSRSLGVMRPAR